MPLDSTCAVTVFPCIFPFFRLKERQIRFERIDLVWANCYRAKRPDTHLPHSLTTIPHNNYMITLSSKALRGYRYATLFAVFIKTLKRLFISTEKTYSRFFFSTFDMDKFGKICRHHLKERLKINKIT